MSSPSTHPSLLDRLRDNTDQSAWREFDEQYRELILRYCVRRGMQAADSEDVRQIVMIGLTKHLPTFEYRPDLGRFRDYLGTIVRNAVRRHFSRQKPLSSELLPDTPIAAESDDPWNEEWQLHHYRTAMGRIRETFEPRSVAIFDGLLAERPVEELAVEFESTPEAIYKIKQRVRERLTEFITRQLREEDFDRPE